METKQYWCDILKKEGFLYIALIVAAALLLVITFVVENISASTIQKTVIKETEAAESYYENSYSVKYAELTDLVNSAFLLGGNLNLRVLGDCRYSLTKEKDTVVLTCEFAGDAKKKETPVIITTTLTSNYEFLKQETNKISKAEYIQRYLHEKVYAAQNIGKFIACFFIFATCYVCFFSSLLISKKKKEQDQAYYQNLQ